MTKPKVVVPYFNRSEKGPLDPLAEVAKRHSDIKLELLDCTALKSSDAVLAGMTKKFKESKPDMVICGFDRPHMTLAAFVAYHMKLPVAQIFAGDYAGGSFDDADRFVISNYSELLFCADRPQFLRLKRALDWCEGKERKDIYISGATHFDHMTYQDPGVRGYTLVLYNPSMYYGKANLEEELDGLRRMLSKIEEVIWVAPNGDPGSSMVEKTAKSMDNVTYLADMPREKFLGLVKYADMFIGNSSCQFYEAPYFGTKNMQVGYRNIYREKISRAMCKPGASEYIIKTIIKHLEEE